MADQDIVLLVHVKGSRITASIKTAWRAAVRRTGIKKPIRLYSIRHKTLITDTEGNMIGLHSLN